LAQLALYARPAYHLSGGSEDFLDYYRFWRERDPELKSLMANDPGNSDS